jgi:tetratricopeptide (TPR) repeat protein
LGYSFLEKKEYDRALEMFTNAINIREHYAQSFPTNEQMLAESYYSRALVYSEMRQFQSAMKDYDRAINIMENYFKKAKEDKGYNRVINVMKNYHAACHNCGRLHSDLGMHKKAAGYFIKALGCDVDNEELAATHNCFGVSLAKAGKKDLALAHFNEALNLSSNTEFKENVKKNIELMNNSPLNFA